MIDLTMGQNVIWIAKKIMEEFARNERMANHLKKDSLAYHQRVWQTDLLCPGGSEYLWNEEFQTFESTASDTRQTQNSQKK